jgi:hypothetical protein
MALSDWQFHTKDSGGGAIDISIDTASPILELGSLLIQDSATPNIAAVAAHVLGKEKGFSYGRVRTVLQRHIGAGFRESGIYFLTNAVNPVELNVTCFYVCVTDGGSSIKIKKTTNGIYGTPITLATYPTTLEIPIPTTTGNAVLIVEWRSGQLKPAFGGTQIRVWFWHGTTDYENAVELTPAFIDPDPLILTGVSEGIYTKTRSSLEPLNAKFDNTRITKFVLK